MARWEWGNTGLVWILVHHFPQGNRTVSSWSSLMLPVNKRLNRIQQTGQHQSHLAMCKKIRFMLPEKFMNQCSKYLLSVWPSFWIFFQTFLIQVIMPIHSLRLAQMLFAPKLFHIFPNFPNALPFCGDYFPPLIGLFREKKTNKISNVAQLVSASHYEEN